MSLLARLTGSVRASHRESVNIASPQFKANPFPFYARLRADAPVFRTVLPTGEPAWLITNPVEIATERFARENATVNGVAIPRGAMIHVVIASANRDERQFVNADVLDITREPNKHLAFGLGAHFCLGAPLARLEAQLAINTVLRRVPELRLAVAPDRLRWRRGLLLRGLEALPVAVRGV
jgi:cytochrome P450 PksS